MPEAFSSSLIQTEKVLVDLSRTNLIFQAYIPDTWYSFLASIGLESYIYPLLVNSTVA